MVIGWAVLWLIEIFYDEAHLLATVEVGVLADVAERESLIQCRVLLYPSAQFSHGEICVQHGEVEPCQFRFCISSHFHRFTFLVVEASPLTRSWEVDNLMRR